MRRAKRKIAECLIIFFIISSLPFLIHKISGEGFITSANQGDVVDQEQTQATSSGSVICHPYWIAQSFKPTLPILTRVEVRLQKFNDISTDVTLIIRDNLTGKNLTYTSVSSSLITHTPSWIEFDFPDIEIEPGKTYYIICKTDGGDWPHRHLYKWSCSDLDPYPHGQTHCSVDGGKSWQSDKAYAKKDQCFRTYGMEKEKNNPPERPQKPTGPNSGEVGIAYTYTTSSLDPDGDRIYYLFDWGDGNESEWIGPYESGEMVSVSHTWNREGNYTVRVRAMDEHGATSEWSDSLSVSVPILQQKNVEIEKLMEELFHGMIRWWNAFLISLRDNFF
ncbi:MAG: PKD domain-containing protein [Thermoplasmata archaeon]|nr:MAG: PKD domain-containing protein [Thermoplasmata archaeon]